MFRGEILGVLALFNRQQLNQTVFSWLPTIRRPRRQRQCHARALAEIEQLTERLELENMYLRGDFRSDAPAGMIGESRAFRKVLEQVAVVAPTTATVLIQGESGTGKELVARAIHDQSPRHHRPLIGANCASIPRDLFEPRTAGRCFWTKSARSRWNCNPSGCVCCRTGVRELQHVIERVVMLSPTGIPRLDGVLSEPGMPEPPVSAVPETGPVVIPEIEWRRRERENHRNALELANGRVYGSGGAAELLGITGRRSEVRRHEAAP